MSLARLRQRIPSAKRLGCFYLSGHQLKFHKLSADGSGKCDVLLTEQSQHLVYGALFKINKSEKSILDKIEGVGVGYEEKMVTIQNHESHQVSAYTYFATHIDASVKPYCWYLNHVLIGAVETGLPEQYIDVIRSIEFVRDKNRQRNLKERMIYQEHMV